MDLVVGAKRVILAMTHVNADGERKILPRCTFPLTARGRVDTIVTEYSVFQVKDGVLWLTELITEMSFEELKAITPATYHISENVARPFRSDMLPLLKG